ncbi:MAG: Gfo/Idh/MocA family oxidoreductase [Armatimonadetes bacterium]|nr:Gfo/Idh/MocA family oxidoreductase [Armatimonadota bacterium]
MLKVGVIGPNHIGKTHARVYQNHPDAQLVCVCDLQKPRADEAAAQFGCKAYYSIEEMLRNEELDAVSVCTGGVENGSAHYEPTMQCLNAGAHVLVEKPISNNIEEAREMVRTAWEKGRYLGVNLNHRFVPPAAKAKSWIEEKKLGELLLVNMNHWIDNPNESSPYFHIRALHPHSFDIMRYFCGPVHKVQAFAMMPMHRQIWSNFSINLLFDNDVVGHLMGSYDASMTHPIQRCEVMGTEGRFVLENVYESLTLYPRRSPEVTTIRNNTLWGLSGFDDTFKNRIGRWVEQVNARVPREEIEGSGEDGLAAQEIIEAAIRSFEGESIVELSESQALGLGTV